MAHLKHEYSSRFGENGKVDELEESLFDVMAGVCSMMTPSENFMNDFDDDTFQEEYSETDESASFSVDQPTDPMLIVKEAKMKNLLKRQKNTINNNSAIVSKGKNDVNLGRKLDGGVSLVGTEIEVPQKNMSEVPAINYLEANTQEIPQKNNSCEINEEKKCPQPSTQRVYDEQVLLYTSSFNTNALLEPVFEEDCEETDMETDDDVARVSSANKTKGYKENLVSLTALKSSTMKNTNREVPSQTLKSEKLAAPIKLTATTSSDHTAQILKDLNSNSFDLEASRGGHAEGCNLGGNNEVAYFNGVAEGEHLDKFAEEANLDKYEELGNFFFHKSTPTNSTKSSSNSRKSSKNSKTSAMKSAKSSMEENNETNIRVVRNEVIPQEVVMNEKEFDSVLQQMSFDENSGSVIDKTPAKPRTKTNQWRMFKKVPKMQKTMVDYFGSHRNELINGQSHKGRVEKAKYNDTPCYIGRSRRFWLFVIATFILLISMSIVFAKSFARRGKNADVIAKNEGSVLANLSGATFSPSTQDEWNDGLVYKSSIPSSLKSHSPSFETSVSPSILKTPTSAPSILLYKSVVDVVKFVSGSSFSVDDTSSYQHTAYKWLVLDQERYQTQNRGRSLTMNMPRLVQRYILMLLYFSMAGFNWEKSDGFGTTLHECEWFGIECVNSKIIGIELGANNLEGSLVSEIAKLTTLESLNLKVNGINSELPKELGYMMNLRKLSLRSNQLRGTIPSSVQYLSSIEDLILYDNKFTGVLPDELAKLTSIETLVLDDNKLTGPIPTFLGSMSSLVTLSMRNNNFKGTIPEELSKLDGLVFLDLGENLLEGTIPRVLGIMSTLQVLSLANNALTDNIPERLGKLVNLKEIDLSQNKLDGSIPTNLVEMIDLADLNLSQNSLVGTLPLLIGNMKKLEKIDVSNNALTGKLPVSIGGLGNLEYLNVEGNQLRGRVPYSIGKLDNLVALVLHENSFVGAIPNATCALKLEVLTSDCAGRFPEIYCDCCTRCYF